jgi:hypothetical protein
VSAEGIVFHSEHETENGKQWNLSIKRQEAMSLARLVYFSKEGVTDFFGAMMKVGE